MIAIVRHRQPIVSRVVPNAGNRRAIIAQRGRFAGPALLPNEETLAGWTVFGGTIAPSNNGAAVLLTDTDGGYMATNKGAATVIGALYQLSARVRNISHSGTGPQLTIVEPPGGVNLGAKGGVRPGSGWTVLTWEYRAAATSAAFYVDSNAGLAGEQYEIDYIRLRKGNW